jgi:predicted Zn-dependent protease
MGIQIIKKLIPHLNELDWPDNTAATEGGRRIYMQGVERIDDYKNNPKVLTATLRLFQTADSQPYALAGVAYLLVAASREADGSYAESGLEAAMHWLEKAQESEPEMVDINMIESLIYIYSGQFENARLVLDYLMGQEPDNHHLHRAEIAYWIAQKDIDRAVDWFDEASRSAVTVPQRLRLRVQLGDLYLNAGQNEKAIEVFKEATHFDKNNHMLWHKISVANWKLKKFEDAEIANPACVENSGFFCWTQDGRGS